MRHLFFLLAVLFCIPGLYAQPCGSPFSSIDLHANNINARILNGGDLFTDLDKGIFQPNPSDPNSPSTMFVAGLWLGGVDPGGNLKLARTSYRGSSGGGDYTAGPLLDGITDANQCSNWDRIFVVKGSEVADFIANPPANAAELIANFKSIAGWPANGNPYFSTVWGFDLPNRPLGFADFFDADGTGGYDPMHGDYPIVALKDITPFVPAEMNFCIFNDQNGGAPHGSNGDALQMEIQQTAWAFKCSGDEVINNTVFTSYKIINWASENTDSFFVGMWIDFDLGCYQDDYVGCNPSRNSMFAYNQDAVDGTVGSDCGPLPTFGANPPVQSATFLNHRLNKFMALNANTGGSSQPTTPLSHYNVLTGTWPDGSPLTDAPTGYGPGNPSNYNYPDDPAAPNGLSMCGQNIPFADTRTIGSYAAGTMEPGEIMEFTMAWTVHPNPNLPCGLGSTFEDIDAVQNHYNQQFKTLCSVLPAREILSKDALKIQPNPASNQIQLQYGSLHVQSVRVFNAAGQMVMEKHTLNEGQDTLDVHALPAGLYTVQLQSVEGMAVRKVVVLR